MARSRRRQKVALRKSHAVYRWKLLSKFCLVAALWCGIVLGGTFAAREGYGFWRDSSWFRIKSIRVDSRVPAGFVEVLGLKVGGHLFRFSPDILSVRLKNAFPELEAVKIRRWLDGSVRVSVDRRVPRARVFDGEKWFCMDGAGVMFPLRSPDIKPEDLPIVAGVAGAQALPLLDLIEQLKSLDLVWTRKLAKAKVDSERDVFLYLQDGTPIYWGLSELDASTRKTKALRLERVLKDDSLKDGVAYARFVDDARIAVKPLPAGETTGNGGK